MGFYLGSDDKVNEIILYELQVLNLGGPDLRYAEDGPYVGVGNQYYIDYNDVGEPLIVSDFDAYLDSGSLSFKFSDVPTETEYNIGRITYGFDEEIYPTFLRVNDLAEYEYKEIMDNIEKRHIPIVDVKDRVSQKLES
jgi:hypothetical protein